MHLAPGTTTSIGHWEDTVALAPGIDTRHCARALALGTSTMHGVAHGLALDSPKKHLMGSLAQVEALGIGTVFVLAFDSPKNL